MWEYSREARTIITTMKYRPSYITCKELAKALGGFVQTQFKQESTTHLPLPEMIIPIPISRSSFAKRRFHQTAILSKEVCKALKLNGRIINYRAIKVTHNHTPQASLPSQARIGNAQRAYTCSDVVSERNILLIDDVVTTGATVNAIASLLLKHTAKSVSVLSLARAGTWYQNNKKL